MRIIREVVINGRLTDADSDEAPASELRPAPSWLEDGGALDRQHQHSYGGDRAHHELTGYPAYQIGGFALGGARFAHPDIDLAQYGENNAAMRDIIAASSLPVFSTS